MVKERTLAAIGRWGMLLPAALVAGFAGLAKFTQAEAWEENFVAWGYPAWMSYVTGVLELGGAVAMLVPATRFYGAAVVTLVMLGAAATRAVNGEYGHIAFPVVVALFAAVTAWWARPDWFDRLAGRDEQA